jgi:hypothetical protein
MIHFYPIDLFHKFHYHGVVRGYERPPDGSDSVEEKVEIDQRKKMAKRARKRAGMSTPGAEMISLNRKEEG